MLSLRDNMYMEICFVTFDNKYLEKSYEWLTDPEINRLTDAGAISRSKQKIWFDNLKIRRDYLIWGVAHNGNPVGTVGIKNINGISGEYFGYIGEKEFWGKGIGKKMLSFAILECKKREIRRIILRVRNDNERAIRLYRKFGFTEETIENGIIQMKIQL